MKGSKETVVISVGGSLICPKEVNVEFLREFKTILHKYIRKHGIRFAVIAGGGKTSRNYQAVASALAKLTPEDIDWMGIYATRLNAQLIHSVLRPYTHPKVITDPTKKINLGKHILVAAGWKPGWSTDYDAVLIAKNLKAKHVVNLSDTDYVYDKDPRKFKDAKPIEEISWAAFRKLIPKKWDPGLSTPFDPVAAREAQKGNIEVANINGNKLAEFEKYLQDKKFIGTVIR